MAFANPADNVCQRGLDPFYIILIKLVKTSWTYSSKNEYSSVTYVAD